MIFQDATASLNPRRSVGKTIAEPLRAAGANDRRTRFRLAAELMEKVGLEPASAFGRRPFEFSSGQCQRISIARALITSPKLLICDEPVSSLDVSVQAQILNLLRKMRARYDLTMLFISHDLAVIKNVSDTVAVMYMGALCEVAPSAVFFPSPLHPYSAILLAAVPGADADKRIYRGSKASAAVAVVPAFASGCHFHARCPYARSRCAKHRPELKEITPERLVACHFPLQSQSAHNSR
jgi:peptide/nickel transport system ATP-binding protein